MFAWIGGGGMDRRWLDVGSIYRFEEHDHGCTGSS